MLSDEQKREIEKKATELLEQTGYPRGEEPVDVTDMANELGFVVGGAVFNDDTDGFILIKEGTRELMGVKTDKLIGINAESTIQWKRFVIAHELGHYMLHYKSGKMYAHRDHKKGKDDIENAADYFAANILLPTEQFKKKYLELMEKKLSFEDCVLLLMTKFNTTHEIVTRRIKELNLSE